MLQLVTSNVSPGLWKTNPLLELAMVRQVTKYERKEVDGPMWRKLVDMSLLNDKATTLPTWVRDQWGISDRFKGVHKQSDQKSKIIILFNGKEYIGSITFEDRKKHKRTPLYRMWLPEELQIELKSAFIMTYIRTIEQKIRNKNAETIDSKADEDIPFNEFLDIEYLQNRVFRLTAHFTQKPTFQYLFQSFVKSHVLQRIEEDLDAGFKDKILKKDWLPKEHLKKMGESPRNVIYYLIDTKNSHYYIGEAQDLLKRVKEGRSEIPGWDYFRYDVLPATYTDRDRLEIERMIIKSFCMLMKQGRRNPAFTNKTCEKFQFSEYTLVNEKIDR